MQFSRGKPTKPGIYKVRGFNLFRPRNRWREAVVEVRLYRGVLRCNLHEINSSDDPIATWAPISEYNDDFEWLGPFAEPVEQ